MQLTNFKEFITDLSYYYLDNKTYNLYKISENKQKKLGNLLENPDVLNPVFIRFYDDNPNFLAQDYINSDTQDIFFILEYSQDKKHIISFNPGTNCSQKELKSKLLEFLPELKEEFNSFDIKQSKGNDRAFPLYSVPNIPCQFLNDETSSEINGKIEKLSLTEIIISNKDQINFNEYNQIIFNIGKISYQLRFTPGQDSIKLRFQDMPQFQSWKNFNIAMSLRDNKIQEERSNNDRD